MEVKWVHGDSVKSIQMFPSEMCGMHPCECQSFHHITAFHLLGEFPFSSFKKLPIIHLTLHHYPGGLTEHSM